MMRNYKKKTEHGTVNYQHSQARTDAHNSVMGEEMSASQAAKYYGVNMKSLLVRVWGDIPVSAHVG